MRGVSLLVFIILFSCNKQEDSTDVNPSLDICLESALNNGQIFYENDKMMLSGGSSDWKFDISNWTLNPCNINRGIGRENFPALIKPEYVLISNEKGIYENNDRCIVMYSKNAVKVYPFTLMQSHEVINEINNGEEVAVVYCVIADFPAVYSRKICGKVLTFAPSGYTYHDANVLDNLRAFVLWDRETESLWWPLIDSSVSGLMNGSGMHRLTKDIWEVMTWEEVNKKYSDALVLKRNQTMPIPVSWTHFDEVCK